MVACTEGAASLRWLTAVTKQSNNFFVFRHFMESVSCVGAKLTCTRGVHVNWLTLLTEFFWCFFLKIKDRFLGQATLSISNTLSIATVVCKIPTCRWEKKPPPPPQSAFPLLEDPKSLFLITGPPTLWLLYEQQPLFFCPLFFFFCNSLAHPLNALLGLTLFWPLFYKKKKEERKL